MGQKIGDLLAAAAAPSSAYCALFGQTAPTLPESGVPLSSPITGDSSAASIGELESMGLMPSGAAASMLASGVEASAGPPASPDDGDVSFAASVALAASTGLPPESRAGVVPPPSPRSAASASSISSEPSRPPTSCSLPPEAQA